MGISLASLAAACGSVGGASSKTDAGVDQASSGGAGGGGGGGAGGAGGAAGSSNDGSTSATDAPAETPPGVLDGSSPARAAESCRLILAAVPGATDGLYWIQPDQGAVAHQMFCDMTTDGGGWTMVFKVNSGLTGDAATLWSGGPLNEDMPAILGPAQGAQNYVSSVIRDFWNVAPFGIRAVRIHLYTAGQLRAFVKFSGNATNQTNWFVQSGLTASSWTGGSDGGTGDLTTTATTNFFSITGDTTVGRRFFINTNYGGCTSDTGWLVVLDTRTGGCEWEDPSPPATPVMRVLYSNGTTAALWQSAAASLADAFAVLVN